MSLPPLWNMECLTWRIPLFTNNSDPGEDPGFAPPESWAQALAAVAQDLRCLRFGAEVVVDRLIWEFSINSDYNVTIGWQGARDIGGFSHFNALSMDTAFADAAVWVADIVQTKLAGYDFVQWPSRGRHLLVPRLRDGEPVWMDPHGDATISRIGELCKNSTNYAAT
ncbi:MAG: hypothetical protein K0Q46_78 [Rhodococcus erythropolis]|nr:MULTISPECIES: hypothetical protein [Rhodococcus]MBT1256637.1 hypothetical protein [Rhodococcus erythropolis]MBY6388205.1 hypothetical protein [Rhodococcus erythropolis]MDF2893292.1 hypothetical protein [Rhodococcus erythropolis]OHF27489.1 hypothetical protein BKP30_12795 [Rhodococcus erythropolis]ORI14197.1 hypothetical protein BH686_32060 [Rhodococcus erythropolis]